MTGRRGQGSFIEKKIGRVQRVVTTVQIAFI
jgi:hypothetical protein